MSGKRLAAALTAGTVLLGGALVAAPATGTPGSSPRVSKGKLITVGTGPSGIAQARGRVFVTNSGSDSISVIRARTNKVIHTIEDIGEPGPAITSPDGKTVYVSAIDSNYAINPVNYKLTKIGGQAGSFTITVSPNGRFLYSSPGAAPITRTNLKSGKTRMLKPTEDMAAMAVSTNGKHLFGSLFAEVEGEPTVHLVKLKANNGKVVRKIPLTEGDHYSFAGDMKLDPRGRFLYVSKQGINNGFTGVSGHTVQRYRPRDLKAKQVYEAGTGDTNVELGPQGLAFSPKKWRTRLAVANSNAGVAFINIKTRKTTMRTKYSGPQYAPTSAVYSRSGSKLFVANTGFGVENPNTAAVYRLRG